MTILNQVHDALADRAQAATDPQVTLGERAVLVTATNPDHGRLAGLAHRPPGDPGPVSDDSVPDLAARATAGDSHVERAIGIATLNALSAPDIDWQPGDPMAALPQTADIVATVGLFQPAFRKFDDVTVRVVERDPPPAATVDAPPTVAVETYEPGACAEAFAGADVCFLTGSALVYGGVDRYLAALADAAVTPVVLVGATASHLPGPAFDAGVDVVAGAWVSDHETVRERVLAGDCGTDLHDNGVEKGYVAADGDLTGLTLDPATERQQEPTRQ